MIHTFSVTVETTEFGNAFTPETVEGFLNQVLLELDDYAGIRSVDVHPITGVIRQHLIGEDTSVV